MCLYIKTNDLAKEKKIADHDIICYKIVCGLGPDRISGVPPKKRFHQCKNREIPLSEGVSFEDLPPFISENPDDTTCFCTPFQLSPITFGERMTASFDKVEWCEETNPYRNYKDREEMDSPAELGMTEEDIEALKRIFGLGLLAEPDDTIDNYRISRSRIDGGVFHSIVNLEDAKDLIMNDRYFYAAFHGNGDFVGIAECIIPKGTEYYVGVFESTGIPSYGSRDIIYKGICAREWYRVSCRCL